MRKLALLLTLFALPLRADLASEIKAADGWIGWGVPIADGRHHLCSWDVVNDVDTSWDNPASELFVLLHVEKGAVRSMRMSSPECRATHPVRWIRNVDPRESARLMLAFAEGADTSVAKKAVTALAMHRDTTDELIRLARDSRLSKVRGHALFWVSQRAGQRAASVLRSAVDNDPEDEVRTKAVFGISQLPNDQSIPLLIELMKTHRSASVRKKAAFWLGQKNDPRALAAFEDILNH